MFKNYLIMTQKMWHLSSHKWVFDYNYSCTTSVDQISLTGRIVKASFNICNWLPFQSLVHVFLTWYIAYKCCISTQ